MSRRQEVQRHVRGLDEIRTIMNSMKNLSLMESHRLTRVLESQQRVVERIERAARAFLAHHPRFRQVPERVQPAWIVIGSERGFCGDYNSALVEHLGSLLTGAGHIIAVGSKLAGELQGQGIELAYVEGPTAVEEVYPVLQRLVETLGRLDGQALHLAVLHHADLEGGIEQVPLLPPFTGALESEPAPPPRLYLTPELFYRQLVEHYLLAALYALFYRSLLVEHQRRVRHLEGTTRRLDEKVAGLTLRMNSLRQEEITEELEVILLGSEILSGARGRMKQP